MSNTWKQLDLEGDGLQSLNLRYSRQRRKTGFAYGLMALFPLGLHRWYLREPVGALAYPALCALTAILVWHQNRYPALAVAISVVGYLAFDVYWIRQRVVTLNKALRMAQFMRPGTRPPPGYRGRYVDGDLEEYVRLKELERGGHQPTTPGDPSTDSTPGAAPGQQPPSFNEQEAMLKELIRSNKGRRH